VAIVYILTSNVTGLHRGPKLKHTFVCQYVAPPGECYYNTVLCCAYYLSSFSVVSRTFSALCVYWSSGIILIPRLPLCLQDTFLSWSPLLS